MEHETDEADLDNRLIFQESDRGAALLAASLLEEILERLLRAFFDEAHRQITPILTSLFDAMGPLGTFAGKSKFAFAARLITETQYEDLEQIRKVRNEFAHTTGPADFTDPRIAKRMEKLHYAAFLKKRIPRYSLKRGSTDDEIAVPEEELKRLGMIKANKAFLASAVKWLLSDFELTIKRLNSHRELLPTYAISTTSIVERIATEEESTQSRNDPAAPMQDKDDSEFSNGTT
ncbi:MAG TPA: MltR family transcriptional regulator [Spirochaetia bacterium]|nr:MltR family transcriptional regulator [Spirochaetia bacterium]